MPKRVRANKRNAKGELDGFDSDLERAVSWKNGSIPHSNHKVKYVKKPSVYKPDFVFEFDGKLLLIEVKGLLSLDDRKKYLAVKDSYHLIAKQYNVKNVELVFVFSNGGAKINPVYKGSKTYIEWATANGFRAITGPQFPDEWFVTDSVM